MDGFDRPSPPYRLIESDQALRHAAFRWAGEAFVALDTEFERTRTFYARPGLIQIFAAERVDLIDPLAINDFSPLGDMIASEQTKVLHAAGEDIGLLRRLTSCEPCNIFDTQVAAAFVGYGYSTSYRALVQAICGVELPKDETRSDWLRRPLRESQLRYASSDVVYLAAMYRALSGLLATQGREIWVREECERTLAATQEPATTDAYRLIAGAWQLDATALGILRALAAWRETEARRSDVPRAHLVPDPLLLELAKEPPTRLEQLYPRANTRAIALKRHRDALLRIIQEASALRPDQLPRELPPPVDGREHAALLRSMKASVKAAADECRIPATLLAPNRMLNELVKRQRFDKREGLTDDLAGWRRQIVGDRLLAIVTAEQR